MHDSPSILMVRSGSYHKHMTPVKEWYSTQHDNWYTVDGERNVWHVWRDCQNVALNCALQIQHYLLRVIKGTCTCTLHVYANTVHVHVHVHVQIADTQLHVLYMY